MLSKLTKVLVAALVLSTTSLALAGSTSARYGQYGADYSYDRNTNGGAGHHVGDTNGF
jgi:hypothetical protein